MKKLFAVSALALGMALSATFAEALTIDAGDLNYIGSINDGIPSGESAEAGYINDLITLAPGAGDTTIGTETYNREGSLYVCGCPTADATGSVKDESGGNTVDVTGFTYLLAKYGGGTGDVNSYVWYVGNLSGDQSVPTLDLGENGLSHTTLFNPTSVPEGGSTLILLGAGLAAVGALRRRFNV